MPEPHANALVLFGETGDLAFKEIFPALYAMTRRGHLNIPVIGVAKSNWTVEQLRDAATFTALRDTLGQVERPLFYLAIPPSLFGTVVSGLARSGPQFDHPSVVSGAGCLSHRSFPRQGVRRTGSCHRGETVRS